MAETKSTSSSVIKDLMKSYSASIIDPLAQATIERLVLDSPKMNYMFGGGFPIGRIVEPFGPESGGKTTLSCCIGGCFQRRKDKPKQNKVLFIDMEHAFDPKHAQTVGLSMDPELFTLVRPLHGEEGFEISKSLLSTGEYGLIIWDSIATTPSAGSMEDEFGKANVGATARVFSEGLKKINPYISRFKTSMILINQVRAKIGGFSSFAGPKETQPGGHAPKFYASWRARVSRGEDLMNKKEVIGNTINIRNVKSKVCPPKRKVSIDLYYASGFDFDVEYIDFIIDLGFVTKGGAWLSNEEWGFKGQGKNSLLDFLKEHPDIFEDVKKKVTESFYSHTVLDEDTGEEEDEDYGEDEEI